jgi:hypothetical protein
MVSEYTPEQIHQSYYSNEDTRPPKTDLEEAIKMRNCITRAGYTAVAGVLMAFDLTTHSAIGLHERGREYIKAGYLIGPYVDNEGVIQHGFKFYKKTIDQNDTIES